MPYTFVYILLYTTAIGHGSKKGQGWYGKFSYRPRQWRIYTRSHYDGRHQGTYLQRHKLRDHVSWCMINWLLGAYSIYIINKLDSAYTAEMANLWYMHILLMTHVIIKKKIFCTNLSSESTDSRLKYLVHRLQK